MIEMPSSLVGVNTTVPNRLVEAAIDRGHVPRLSGYDAIHREVAYGDHSRIDLLLEGAEHLCFVEVKNCTLVENSVASFPDAVTTRGLRHLKDLQKEVRRGNRAVMFYLVQRMDAHLFEPADRVDPVYGRELRKASRRGVEILVYDVLMDSIGIRLNRALPHDL